jgi:hypothetical protein
MVSLASGEAQVEATKGYAEGIFDQAMHQGGQVGPFYSIVFVVIVGTFRLSFCLLPSTFCLLCPHFFWANAVQLKGQGIDFGLYVGQLLLGGGDGFGPGLGTIAEGGTLDLQEGRQDEGVGGLGNGVEVAFEGPGATG